MDKIIQTIRQTVKKTTLTIIRFYQRWISAALPPHCRYHPTCSCYMAEAIETHGLTKGGLLGMRRLSRCHPFREGGYDPVPGRQTSITQTNTTESHPS